MNKPHAVRQADQKVLLAFMSQLILCQYATGTIGKFLSCIVTKHRQFGYPSPLVYREMGSWLMGWKKNTSSGVKTTLDTNSHSIDRILAYHLAFTRTQSILVQLGTLSAFWQSEWWHWKGRECQGR